MSQPATQILAFNIADGTEVRMFFYGKVTRAGIAKLIALLEASKDTFPKIEQEPSHAE